MTMAPSNLLLFSSEQNFPFFSGDDMEAIKCTPPPLMGSIAFPCTFRVHQIVWPCYSGRCWIQITAHTTPEIFEGIYDSKPRKNIPEWQKTLNVGAHTRTFVFHSFLKNNRSRSTDALKTHCALECGCVEFEGKAKPAQDELRHFPEWPRAKTEDCVSKNFRLSTFRQSSSTVGFDYNIPFDRTR